MEENGFNGLFIPLHIWEDKSLSVNEKYYLSLYLQFDKNYKIAEFYMSNLLSTTIIIKTRKQLAEKELIQLCVTPESAKQYVLHNKSKGIACEWCGTITSAIQEHHYLLRKQHCKQS